MTSAYLVADLNITAPFPLVVKVGIYSAPPEGLTMSPSMIMRIHRVLIRETTGMHYANAELKMRALIWGPNPDPFLEWTSKWVALDNCIPVSIEKAAGRADAAQYDLALDQVWEELQSTP